MHSYASQHARARACTRTVWAVPEVGALLERVVSDVLQRLVLLVLGVRTAVEFHHLEVNTRRLLLHAATHTVQHRVNTRRLLLHAATHTVQHRVQHMVQYNVTVDACRSMLQHTGCNTGCDTGCSTQGATQGSTRALTQGATQTPTDCNRKGCNTSSTTAQHQYQCTGTSKHGLQTHGCNTSPTLAADVPLLSNSQR